MIYKTEVYGYWSEEDIEDFKNQFEIDELPPDEWEEAEKRMDIIGQNGNDGEHYSEGFANMYTHTEEEAKLEEQLSKTSKVNKYGPKGWKTLTKKLEELKKKKNDDDDLIIRY